MRTHQHGSRRTCALMDLHQLTVRPARGRDVHDVHRCRHRRHRRHSHHRRRHWCSKTTVPARIASLLSPSRRASSSSRRSRETRRFKGAKRARESSRVNRDVILAWWMKTFVSTTVVPPRQPRRAAGENRSVASRPTIYRLLSYYGQVVYR